MINGDFDETLSEHYVEGQTISFTCNSDYIEDPSDGLIECGKDGWIKTPNCRSGKVVNLYVTKA